MEKREVRAKQKEVQIQKSEREAVLGLLSSVFSEGEFLHLALRKLFTDHPYFDKGREPLLQDLHTEP